MKQDLSIVIPFYFGENHIINLIQSLERSYNTSDKKIKPDIILIIDSVNSDIAQIEKQLAENLTDEFFSIIKIFKNNKNIGAALSRNFGLSLSLSEFITFIDQDDFVEDKYFSVLENTIKAESDFDYYLLNGFYVEELTRKKIPFFYVRPKINLKRIIGQNRIKTPGMIVFNKNTLIKNSCKFVDLDPNLKGCDDWYLLIDLYFKKPELEHCFVSYKIFNYLFHGKNYSNNLRISILGSIKVLSHFGTLYPFMESAIRKNILRLEFEYSIYNNRNKIKAILKNPKGLFLFLIVRFSDLNRLLFSTNRIFHNISFRI
jgi:glycosyltransferase involved in cell wall biosynthesis